MKPQQLPDEPTIFRSARIDRAGVDVETRSFPIVLTTETPVRVYDLHLMDFVDEILHADGAQLPSQIPLVDTHDRSTVSNTLGSIRELKRSGGDVVGRAYFGRSERAVQAFNDYADGHLTDFSVGARQAEDGVEYSGSTKHVRSWKPHEGSAVLVGADPNAKALLARRAYTNPEQVRNEVMFAQVREQMLKRGLKADASDAEVVEFVERLAKPEGGKAATAEQNELADVIRSLKSIITATPAAPIGTSTATPAVDLKVERKRVADLNEMFRQHDALCTPEERQKWLEDGTNADAVSRELLGRLVPKADPTKGGRISGGVSEREKFYAAASDALVQRSVGSQRLSPSQAIDRFKAIGDFDAVQRCQEVQRTFEKPADGVDRFRYVGLPDLARMFLEQAGERVDGLSKPEIARRAMRMAEFCDVQRSGGYHTTGSFSNLMLDAANKTLRMAYDEAPSTWEQWVRRAPSTPDLKTLNRVQLGAVANPEEIPELGEYPESTTSDTKESYYPTKKGLKWSMSLEMVINDDQDGLSRVPAMLGAAMKRRVNADCYTKGLTSNAVLSDGVTLFASARANGANNALTVANLNTAFTAMAVQTALGETRAIMNLEPRYLIVPKALLGTAWQLVNSMADPGAGGSAAGNSNTANIFGPNGMRKLQVISDGVLDGDSTAKWYLAADATQIDTVEITFVQGYEAPVIEREDHMSNDSIHSYIKQFYGVKTIDFRGLYRGGAAAS